HGPLQYALHGLWKSAEQARQIARRRNQKSSLRGRLGELHQQRKAEVIGSLPQVSFVGYRRIGRHRNIEPVAQGNGCAGARGELDGLERTRDEAPCGWAESLGEGADERIPVRDRYHKICMGAVNALQQSRRARMRIVEITKTHCGADVARSAMRRAR